MSTQWSSIWSNNCSVKFLAYIRKSLLKFQHRLISIRIVLSCISKIKPFSYLISTLSCWMLPSPRHTSPIRIRSNKLDNSQNIWIKWWLSRTCKLHSSNSRVSSLLHRWLPKYKGSHIFLIQNQLREPRNCFQTWNLA